MKHINTINIKTLSFQQNEYQTVTNMASKCRIKNYFTTGLSTLLYIASHFSFLRGLRIIILKRCMYSFSAIKQRYKARKPRTFNKCSPIFLQNAFQCFVKKWVPKFYILRPPKIKNISNISNSPVILNLEHCLELQVFALFYHDNYINL